MSAARRALVTGATSGLGREMARQLAERGCRVAVTGRREAELHETARIVEQAGGECLPLCGSVTEPDVVRSHYAAVRETWGGLDLAVLNAGIGDGVVARSFCAETYRRVLETNVLGATNWLEAVLPDMIKTRSGTVAGISSLAAWRGLPGAGAYCASKAALAVLLESTRVDLRGTGVHVVIVQPGFVKNGGDPAGDKGKPFLMELDHGVRCILSGIDRRQRVVHFPWQLSYLMKYGIHNLPAAVYDWLIGRMGR